MRISTRLFTVLAVGAAAMSFQSAFAQSFTVDGINYEVISAEDKTVQIVKKTPAYEGDIVIPATVSDEGVEYTVTEVGASAFEGARYLTSVKLPDGIVKFNKYAFYNCAKLTTLNLPAELVSMESYALAECQILAELNLPEKLESIGEKACYRLKAVKEVTFPASLTKLGYNAFTACTGMTTLNIGAGVVNFGAYAFDTTGALKVVNVSNMTNLCKCTFGNNAANPIVSAGGIYIDGKLVEDVVIPEGIDEIPGNLFRSCASVKTVTLPSTTTYVKGSSFFGCYNITDVYCHAVTPPETTGNTFSTATIGATCKLHVPNESIEAYKAARYWNDFQNIVALTSGVDAVEEEAFEAATPVYNVLGIKVAEVSSPAEIQTLAKGLYIAKGKKYMVR